MAYKKIFLLMLMLGTFAYAIPSGSGCFGLDQTYLEGYEKYETQIVFAIDSSGLRNYVENPEALVAAVISRESSWNHLAGGDNGDSIGLMQINIAKHPECSEAALRAFDTNENIKCGVNFLTEIASSYNVNTPKTYTCNNMYGSVSTQYVGKDAILRWYNGWGCGKGDALYVDNVNEHYDKWSTCVGSQQSSGLVNSPGSISPSPYGQCGQPWSQYTCQKIVDDKCPQDGYESVVGLCPRYGNDILCCIPAEEKARSENLYGSCTAPYESSKCELVTKIADGQYVCPDTSLTPVTKHCVGSASFIQCCVPEGNIIAEDHPSQKENCGTPYENYECTAPEACSGKGIDGCGDGKVCCVPFDSFVAKEYVYDNAGTIDAKSKQEADNTLEALDNPNKFKFENQIRTYIVIETYNDRSITTDFLKNRFKELSLDTVKPSALIVIDTNSRNAYAYSLSRPLARELEAITKKGNIKQLLDNSKFDEAITALARYMEDYVRSYSRIKTAADSFSKEESCYRFNQLILALADEMDVSESTKANLVDNAIEDANVACSRAWSTLVSQELLDEENILNAALKKEEDTKRFFTRTPPCDPSNNGKYACIITNKAAGEGAPQLTYEVRQCFGVKQYISATTVSLDAGNACVSPDAGPDDAFNTGFLGIGGYDGQVRCVKVGTNYALSQCNNGAWYVNSQIPMYTSQDNCADACATTQGLKDFCTEPKVTSSAGIGAARNGIIEGQSLDLAIIRDNGGITLNSYNANPNQKVLDRPIYHAVKYKIMDGRNSIERRQECQDQQTCLAKIPPEELCTGCIVQYWSEMSFAETSRTPGAATGKITYIRSPASGVRSFKITGEVGSDILPSSSPDSEIFSNWQETDSQKHSSFTDCRAACIGKFGCMQQEESDIPEELPANYNVLDYLLKENQIVDGLTPERDAVTKIRQCYAASGKQGGDFAACYDRIAAGGPSKFPYEVQMKTNSRLLMLKSVDVNFDAYQSDPGLTTCKAAFEAAQAVEHLDDKPWQNVEYLDLSGQKKSRAYEIAVEKCIGVNGGEEYLAQAREKRKVGFPEPFITGFGQKATVLTEPKVIAIGALLIGGEIVAKAIPVGGDVVMATQVVRGWKIIKTTVEVSFAYHVGKSLLHTSVQCYKIGILNSAECGEAFADAMMFVPLATGIYRNGKAVVKITKDLNSYTKVSDSVETLKTEIDQSLAEVELAKKKLEKARNIEDALTAQKLDLQAKVDAKTIEVAELNKIISDLETRAGSSTDISEGTGVLERYNPDHVGIFKISDLLVELKKTRSSARGLQTRYTNQLRNLENTKLDRASEKADEALDELDEVKRELQQKKKSLNEISENGKKLLAVLIDSGDLTAYIKRSKATIIKNEFRSLVNERKKSGKGTGCVIGGFCLTNAEADGLLSNLDVMTRTESRDLASDVIVMKTYRPNAVSNIFTNSEISSIRSAFDDVINSDQVQVSQGAPYIQAVRNTKNYVNGEIEGILEQARDPALDANGAFTIAVARLETLIESVRGQAPEPVITRLEALRDRIVQENDANFQRAEAEAEAAFNERVARPETADEANQRALKEAATTSAENLAERLSKVKETLAAQTYADGSGTHVTTLENALSIAKDNALQPSDLSGQVDVYIKQPGQPINLVVYKGSTYPVVIEIPSTPTRQITYSGSAGVGGRALEQGKSYVTVNDARFHTIDGPPEGLTRQEFLDSYGSTGPELSIE